ncbi:MAG: SMC-Scp complex subunit ScpB [Gemmataceae bacterium]
MPRPSILSQDRLPVPNRQALPRDRKLPSLYRVLEDVVETEATGEGVRDAATAMVEAILLCAAEPLPVRKLATLAGLVDSAEARRIVQKLRDLYNADATAFQVEEVAGGFQLLSRPNYYRWLVRHRNPTHDLRLSPAARETLAIVAYKQPIMRAELEKIRGVQSGELLRQLMEKGLVRISGRHDSLGRPVLYGTTKKFLQVYGLKNIKDLPELEDTAPQSNKS